MLCSLCYTIYVILHQNQGYIMWGLRTVRTAQPGRPRVPTWVQQAWSQSCPQKPFLSSGCTGAARAANPFRDFRPPGPLTRLAGAVAIADDHGHSRHQTRFPVQPLVSVQGGCWPQPQLRVLVAWCSGRHMGALRAASFAGPLPRLRRLDAATTTVQWRRALQQ